VLTHLKHLYLAALLKHLDRLHVGFFDDLDCCLLTSLYVCTKCYETELPFAKSVAKLVKLTYVCEVDRSLQFFQPNFLELGRVKIEDARLVGRKYNLDRIVQFIRIRIFLGGVFFDECPSKAVHHSELSVLLITVTEYLVAT